MSKETVEILVEGGKATAGAQMGQSLGPLGINISDVLGKINEKTSSFKGMKVPVKVIVDKDTKKFDLEIGTPPVAELIKKELNIKKASPEPNKQKIANISIEQVIKIAKMKQDSMFINSLKSAVKSIIGSCNSLGVLIEGKTAKEINEDINNSLFDKEISEEKTEPSEAKKKKLLIQLAEVQKKLKKELEKLEALEHEEEAEEKPETEEVIKEGKEEQKEKKPKEKEQKETKKEFKKEKE